ncbi:MAG: class I tRNA ligase family protein, partial [Candidatus Marinimicrobia bacterium]|nr:class I tRNA ligase family protein [Candidatus Neomarinimicrobiota bacterium]
RTTEKRHTDRVIDLLNSLYEKGEIYADEYEGLYSVSEERFVTEKEVEEGDFRQIKKLKEKNYFFKMSKYQSALIEHIESHPDFIKPESRRNEVLGFLRKPLNDLCISRPKSRLNWGIEIPFDKDYVTYVWFDALLNYITAIGWGSEKEKFKYYWPANYHLIGKDILTTHAVYWPTMLLATGLPLPKTIFAHGWWMSDKSKMSKSIGNVVDPLDLIDAYGVDSVRFFLMRDMVLGMDANFSTEAFIKRYNADLANDYGNLVNRVTMLIHKYFDGKIPTGGNYNETDLELLGMAKTKPVEIKKEFSQMKIHDALENTMSLLRKINAYLETKTPWKTVKEDNSEESSAATTLAISADILRIGSQLLQPVMPEKTTTILTILGAQNLPLSDTSVGTLKAGTILGEGKSPFPRIQTS